MPDKPKDAPTSIPIMYQQDVAYRECYANGAYGGVTQSQAGFVVWFYLERQFDPESYDANVTAVEGGGYQVESNPNVRQGLVRVTQVAVHMTPQNALSIGLWLQRNAQEALNTEPGHPTSSGEIAGGV